ARARTLPDRAAGTEQRMPFSGSGQTGGAAMSAEEIQEREAESKPENTPAEGAASEEMILLPVKSLVLFPGLVLPIVVNRQASLYAAQEAVRRERPIGVVLQQN